MSVTAINAPQFTDETAAREHLEAIRWPHGPVCPHCGSVSADHYRLEGKGGKEGTKARPGLLKCKDCREQFSVTVGTVFEDSKVPLTKWLLAMHLMCSSKKGISSHQLHRTLGVTYKTAWFMSHRIRAAMAPGSTSPLGGEGKTVEADETYLAKSPKTRKPKGTPLNAKPAPQVFSLVERGGDIRSMYLDERNVRDALAHHLHDDSRLVTDGSTVYKGQVSKHESVDHSKYEWVRGDVHTNTLEGYFSIFKRGLVGT